MLTKFRYLILFIPFLCIDRGIEFESMELNDQNVLAMIIILYLILFLLLYTHFKYTLFLTLFSLNCQLHYLMHYVTFISSYDISKPAFLELFANRCNYHDRPESVLWEAVKAFYALTLS